MPRAVIAQAHEQRSNAHIELEYELLTPAGSTQNTSTILLIRGLGTQMIEWPDEFLQGLMSRGLQVLIFDNRDVGLSSKCEDDYTLSDMAADVVGLLDVLDIQQAHVFGISLGGMVAQLIGVEHATRVLSLFSVMSGSGNPDVPTVSADMLPYLSERADDRASSIELTVRNKALFGSPGYPEDEVVRRAQAEAAYDRCYCPQGVARQMRAATADGSRVERLNGIRLPTMVIHGEDDALVSIAAGEDTARSIPNAEMVRVPGMGHNIPAALAPHIVNLVDDFIRRRT